MIMNQLMRMVTRMIRVNGRQQGMGPTSGQPRSPEEKAQMRRQRQQARNLRQTTRVLRKFGRF
jgi:ribosomal protein L19E